MNTQTNVQTVALAGFLSTLLMWLTGYFLPDLMKTAPAELGSGFTTLFVMVLTAYLPQDFMGAKQ